MSTSPVWIGSTALEPQANSPEEITNGDGTTWIARYEGLAATVEANKPDIGDIITGIADTTHSVANYRVTPAPGGRKILEITLLPNALTGGGSEGPTDTTSYDLDIAQFERPIETHPRYATPGSHTDFSERLADTVTLDQEDELGNPISGAPSDDPADIDVPLAIIWDHIKRLPFEEARRLYLRVPEANRPILTDLWEEWAGGQETYFAYYPQATAQDYSLTTPSVGDFGKTVTPPTGIEWPTGFQALRCGGRYTRPKKTGRFRREIHYVGAPSWPAKFYPPA